MISHDTISFLSFDEARDGGFQSYSQKKKLIIVLQCDCVNPFAHTGSKMSVYYYKMIYTNLFLK